ncbi:Jerky protein-like protein [Plecturocebus cupreus]
MMKQKDILLKFYAERDKQKLMKNRKTLHKAINEDLNHVLKELKGTVNEYSTSWLLKFKKRHDIEFLKMCDNKASADHEAVGKFIDKFAKVIADENLIPEQVCNADKASPFRCYCSRKTLATVDDSPYRN